MSFRPAAVRKFTSDSWAPAFAGVTGNELLFRGLDWPETRRIATFSERNTEADIDFSGLERDEHFIRQAIAEAEKAFDEGEVPVGAVVVLENRIVGRGHNQTERLKDATAHAEMIALSAAAEQFESWRLLGAELFVTIEPCAMCAGAAVLGRVERIVFGVRDPKFGACGSIFNIPTEERLNHRIAVTEGVLAEQARALLVSFFQERRKKGKTENDE